MSLELLVNIVERLHEQHKMNAAVGPRGYLLREQGGVFLLGDYKNNCIERRKAEVERVSGLLDWILEATVMLDKEQGGSLSSPLSETTVAVCCLLATGKEDDRLRSTAGSLLLLALILQVSNL